MQIMSSRFFLICYCTCLFLEKYNLHIVRWCNFYLYLPAIWRYLDSRMMEELKGVLYRMCTYHLCMYAHLFSTSSIHPFILFISKNLKNALGPGMIGNESKKWINASRQLIIALPNKLALAWLPSFVDWAEADEVSLVE